MKRSGGGGVADYFAILGIGETLELKSTQKKYQRVSLNGGNSNGSNSNGSNSNGNDVNSKERQKQAILEEEECAMVERFYREIVEVCIFTAYSDSSAANGNSSTGNGNGAAAEFDFVGGSLATSIGAHGDFDDYDDFDDYSENYTENYYEEDLNDFNGYSRDKHQYPHHHSNRHYTNQTNNNHHKHSQRKRGYDCKGRYQISSIVPSPKKLSRKTIVNQSKNNNDVNDANVGSNNGQEEGQNQDCRQTTTSMLPKEISGFKIIYETITSSQRRYNDNATTAMRGNTCINPNVSGISNGTFDHDSSFHPNHHNASLQQNSTLDSTTMTTTTNNNHHHHFIQQQSLDADLNPTTSTGLLSTIQSFEKIQQDLSFTNSSFEATTTTTNNNNNTTANHNNNNNNIQQTEHRKEHWTRFHTIKKQLSPILATKTKAIIGSSNNNTNNNNNHHHHQNYNNQTNSSAAALFHKHFYIGYRRRGADENDKPAVADLLLMYCKVHKETIVETDIQRNFQMGIGDCSEVQVGGGGDRNDTSFEEHHHHHQQQHQGSPKQNIAPKTAVLLKRGLLSGANLAKRVAVSGKNRLLRVRSSDQQQEYQNEQQHEQEQQDGIDYKTTHYQRQDYDNEDDLEYDTFNQSYHHDHDEYEEDYDDDDDDDEEEEEEDNVEEILYMHEILELPKGFENGEWIIPCAYQSIKIPLPPRLHRIDTDLSLEDEEDDDDSSYDNDHHMYKMTQAQKDELLAEKRMKKTFLFNHKSSPTWGEGIGVEAFVNGDTFLNKSHSNISEGSGGKGSPVENKRNPWSPICEPPDISLLTNSKQGSGGSSNVFDPNGRRIQHNHQQQQTKEDYMPSLISREDVALALAQNGYDDSFIYIPIIAVRRQRIGEEERYHEDPGMIDIAMTLSNHDGSYAIPEDEEYDEFDGNGEEEVDEILGKSKWSASSMLDLLLQTNNGNHHNDIEEDEDEEDERMLSNFPTVIFQHNLPNGFLDTPFSTSVLDRFPSKDYVGAPLPEEELPMFCYPTGCRLFRARYQDAPLADYYGFVVKNERGDNIHVSCVSFMEPLEVSKLEQLDQISEKKRRTSLAHRLYCEKKERAAFGGSNQINDDKSSFLLGFDEDCSAKNGVHLKTDMVLTAFDELMTFELKTICLIGRYPFWSAFRRFLSHLHILSGSSSELPLERYISHLLLAVSIPKPGGQCTLLPLPAIASPMVLSLPPAKDLPLLDLPCHRLFSCLDAPTVVTIVLGFLVLERKVIIMSTYPSLVSDVCEILRSLLFPFELCAPYVPRLTSPFMSCLQFPGAIFVGIHDDGNVDGLAASVRKEIPEDTFIVDLDTGDIDCNGDRYEVLKDSWDIIPSELRSLLVEEIETLCQDAKLVPGQEPLGAEIEAALDVSITPTFGDDDDEMLDDRAIRDSFLRFFCSILGGYERFLVVPDMDFLISGNEWFDSKGFLNATKSQSRAAFLSAFISTQLFQSFVQRRTEASDVRCLLFDECLAEFHSSKVPYGRLSRYAETSGYMRGNRLPYDLLVDQCASDGYDNMSDIDELSSAEVSILTTHTMDGFMMVNNSGDFVTAPSRKNLPSGMRYVYCSDGHPHFPQKLDPEMFYPKEPKSLSADLDEESVPILTRSDRENDVSKIRRKLAVTHRGVQRQRRCLFQLPKLMGSHFLNSWLMCIPSQISQKLRSPDQQKSYILRALGALRILRSRQRIVPDEAGYRCLIIACGRVESDRRQELVKLFGLLRSDGIFPSAVTLGQYTRAIAEGFSKRSSGRANSSIVDHCIRDDELIGATEILDADHPFDFLDGNLVELEEFGNRWRSSRDTNKVDKIDTDGNEGSKKSSDQTDQDASRNESEKKRTRRKRHKAPWSPVNCSSSFSPHWKPNKPPDETFDLMNDFRFIAMWSRTTTCSSCFHTLLDEEIQAGWDEINADNEHLNEVRCPCCGAMTQPQIGCCELSHESLISSVPIPQSPESRSGKMIGRSSKEALPPQLQTGISNTEPEDDCSFQVPYLNPARLRQMLEEIVEEHGEDGLERETLRRLSPEIFYNLWWYCARFSLPLPLAVSANSNKSDDENGSSSNNHHLCAFASWDKSLALAGCRSGAKAVRATQTLIRKSFRPKVTPSFQKLVKSFDPSDNTAHIGDSALSQSILSEEFPLLSYLNLQSLAQGDWDNADLAAILVPLVEACDKRDFLPALKAVLQCNINRRTRYGKQKGSELECYQTLIYLTRYQCTSAFHKFFPATVRACKGYHFWCPHSTVTIFDRMFREASDRLRQQGNSSAVYDVSDIALGFRSVFGHII